VINIRSKEEINKISTACSIVKDTLYMLEENITSGISTLELDSIAEQFIKNNKGVPAFKGLYGYPSTICTSVDNEVVHGLPTEDVLFDGQIIGIDVGAIYKGYYGDHAKTFSVGGINKEKEQLIDITRQSLLEGIKQAKPGNHIGDIGYAIQSFAEKHGYSVVRELVGHGIGSKLHEEPQIPNYGKSGYGPKIEVGMCFAIEPMVNYGGSEIYTKDDGWTVCTKDGKPSAHFEHTITILDNGNKILTI